MCLRQQVSMRCPDNPLWMYLRMSCQRLLHSHLRLQGTHRSISLCQLRDLQLLSALDMIFSFKLVLVEVVCVAPFVATDPNLTVEAHRNPFTRPCVTRASGIFAAMWGDFCL